MGSIILVIDDTPESAALSQRYLEGSGYQVLIAKSGEAGVEMAKIHQPDLILCDLNMLDITGLEVLQALRAYPATALTPIILVTADDERGTHRRGMQLGADDFLTRPLQYQALIGAVQGQLQKYRQLLQVYQGQVDELEQIQSQLNIMIAHELRTPLITVTMAHELLRHNRHKLSDGQQDDLLSRMEVGIQRLRHLVEQMVLMVQLETGILDKEGIRMSGASQTCWELLPESLRLARKFDYRDRGVKVRLVDATENVIVNCHPPSLKHAFAELINNALKFSPDESEVVISQEQTAEHVFVNILDYGTGIAEDKLKNAFLAYRQLQRETLEQQGIGMGLPLAKRIIEAHDGELVLKSLPEKGTQAVVILPRYDF